MKDNKKDIVAPVAAGAVGLIVGATGAIAALAAADKSVRKMVVSRFNMAKDTADRGIKYVMEHTQGLRRTAKGMTKK